MNKKKTQQQTRKRNPRCLQRVVRPRTSISYRAHPWFDTKSRTAKHGIQAKAVGYEARWLHCAENGEPLIFDTETERDAKLKELRKRSNAKLSDADPSTGAFDPK